METKTLAKYVAELQYEDLSAKSISMAKQCMLDWLGVCIRGSQEKPIKIIHNILLSSGGKEEASVFSGNNIKTSALQGAFCNGSASHSLDFDDLHNASIIHLACVVVPPVFAVAESHRKSGRDMILATVAGYEVGARVGESVLPDSYFFWHTTGTAGTFGAAASAGRLMNLDAEKMNQCLGSAGTQAAGLWEFLKEGAMSKTLHAGKSCYAGVLSAYLARDGFTAASEILEGEKGFCRAMMKEPKLYKLTENIGNGKFKIDDNSFKPYACCKHTHAANFAVKVFRGEKNISPQDVEEIALYVNKITGYLVDNPDPQNPYGCKFSIQYCVAAMLKHGQLGVGQFAPDVINDEEVRSLMKKIRVIEDPAIEKIFLEDSTKLASKIIVKLKDGSVLEKLVEYPKGDPDNAFTWEESVEKFMSLAAEVYTQDQAKALVNLIRDLDRVDDFRAKVREIVSC